MSDAPPLLADVFFYLHLFESTFIWWGAEMRGRPRERCVGLDYTMQERRSNTRQGAVEEM